LSLTHPYDLATQCPLASFCYLFYFFTVTASTSIYTLSLHDALPIFTAFRFGYGSIQSHFDLTPDLFTLSKIIGGGLPLGAYGGRSEEHTSELQSRENLVCRLLLEKKKK